MHKPIRQPVGWSDRQICGEFLGGLYFMRWYTGLCLYKRPKSYWCPASTPFTPNAFRNASLTPGLLMEADP